MGRSLLLTTPFSRPKPHNLGTLLRRTRSMLNCNREQHGIATICNPQHHALFLFSAVHHIIHIHIAQDLVCFYEMNTICGLLKYMPMFSNSKKNELKIWTIGVYFLIKSALLGYGFTHAIFSSIFGPEFLEGTPQQFIICKYHG